MSSAIFPSLFVIGNSSAFGFPVTESTQQGANARTIYFIRP